MVQRRTKKRRQSDGMSRRHILIGLTIGGTSALMGICGVTSVGAYLLGSRLGSQSEKIEATFTPEPVPLRPAIVSRDGWGALAPNHSAENEHGFFSEDNVEGWRVYEGDLKDNYQTVIVHHSAFYDDTDLRTIEHIQETHRNNRGWADIGYHFLVGRTGVIFEGRDWTVRGTHIEGFNTGSLGICLLGNFMQQLPTDAQVASARRLINWTTYHLELTHIAAHQTFNDETLCPGDNLIAYLPEFAANANLKLGTDGYIAPDYQIECTCCACNSDSD